MRGCPRFRITAFGIAALAALRPVAIEAGEESDEPRLLRSPGGRWSCSFVWDSVREVQKVYLAPSDRPKDRKLLLQCERWAGGEWSPDERWFAVVRQPDGHVTDLVIYHITGDPAHPNGWGAEAEYRTPQQDRCDAKWKVISWNIPEGTVRITCEFVDDSVYPAIWANRTYLVPIEARSARKPAQKAAMKKQAPGKGPARKKTKGS